MSNYVLSDAVLNNQASNLAAYDQISVTSKGTMQ